MKQEPPMPAWQIQATPGAGVFCGIGVICAGALVLKLILWTSWAAADVQTAKASAVARRKTFFIGLSLNGWQKTGENRLVRIHGRYTMGRGIVY
jgi:hypothetical protein